MTDTTEYAQAWQALLDKDDKVESIKRDISERQGLLNRVTTTAEFEEQKHLIKARLDEIDQLDALARQAIQNDGCIAPLLAVLNKAPTIATPSEINSATKPDTPRKPDRVDQLRQAMEIGIEEYQKKHRAMPTARALFNWLPENDITDCVREIDYDRHRDTELIIWATAGGKIKTTTFSSFQTRMTRLLKNRR